jgi:hypothetical protein
MPTLIHERRCPPRHVWWRRLPERARGGDPWPVAAVVVAPRPRRAVAVARESARRRPPSSTRTRGGGGSPIQRTSDGGPLCGLAATTPRPQGGREAASFPRRASKRRPPSASSDGSTRSARVKRRHGRREVSAAAIAPCVTSSDPAQFERPEWWPPSVLVSSTMSSSDYLLWFMLSFDYCVLCVPHALFTLKTVRFYTSTRSSYINLLHAYFLYTHWKDNSMIYTICNFHKKSNQIIYVCNCQVFTSAIKLSLIPTCS